MADKATTIKEAQKYLAKGQIDKAIAEWEKLANDSPDATTYNTIGDLHLKRGDKKSAVQSYYKAANLLQHEGFSTKALALYKKALNIIPNDPDALFSLGELSEEKGIIPDAIKYYLAAADSLAKEGKKDRILEVYEKILSLSPANIPLRIKVADIFIKEGLATSAAKEYVTIAKIHEDKEEYPKAKEFFQKAISTQPRDKNAHIGLSRLLEKLGDKEQAVKLAKDAAVLFPDDVDVLLRSAEISLQAHQSEDAKKLLKKVQGSDPANQRAHMLLAEIYMEEGDREQAWAEYEPILDDVLLNMSYDDAIAFIEPFKEVKPVETSRRLVSMYRQLGETADLAAELTALGTTLRAHGEEEEALACFREALEINPDDVYLQNLLSPEEERQPEEAPIPEGISPAAEPEDWEKEIFLQQEAAAAPPTEAPPEQPAKPTGEQKPAEFKPVFTPEEPHPSARIDIKAAKPVDEIFTEADIFSRYGLVQEARKLLDDLNARDPDNIDLHLRLKTICGDTNDKEGFVTECLRLKELYEGRGETDAAERMLREAAAANPSDPRLAALGVSSLLEEKAFGEHVAGMAPSEEVAEDYDEQIAEADFYARQGLTTEAMKILEHLHTIYPENPEVAERLATLGQGAETWIESEAAEAAPPSDAELMLHKPEGFSDADLGAEEKFESPAEEPEMPGKTAAEFEPVYTGPEEIPAEPEPEALQPAAAEEKPAGEGDFTFSMDELVEAQEMPEPALDNDVLEVFSEFKKGLEKELDKGDSETHYNLGIAYKEMGLIDDAITEFQTAKIDPQRFMQAATMLGACYMEKKLGSLAIDTFRKILEKVSETDESYLAVKYDLAEAYFLNNDLQEALDIYTEVFGWNAKFRNVAERLSEIRARIKKTEPAEKPPEQQKPRERKDRVSYL